MQSLAAMAPTSRSAGPVKITVLLSFGERLCREALTALLGQFEDVAVVGAFSDGAPTLAAVAQLRPRVVVAAASLRGLSGLELAGEIALRANPPGVLLLCSSPPQVLLDAARQHGATVIDQSVADGPTLVREIRRLCAPGARTARPQRNTPQPASADPLTPREREVLELAAQSATSAEIARILSISPRTVEVHRMRAMQKLGLETALDLFFYAVRRGIIVMPS